MGGTQTDAIRLVLRNAAKKCETIEMKAVPSPDRSSSKITLLDGDQVVLVTGHKYGDISTLHDVNHNCYRLNCKDEIIWQIQRDDSNRPSNWWEILHAQARERGEDGAREPFMYIWLRYPDGSLNADPKTGSPPDVASWTPNCEVLLTGSAYQQYVLDLETGVAKNVTEGRPRPW